MERSRGWQKFKYGMKRAYQRYDRMMEKQGFYVVLAICVLVIGLSAFYTFRLRSEEEEPVLTSGEAESADSSQAQTLSEAKELVSWQRNSAGRAYGSTLFPFPACFGVSGSDVQRYGTAVFCSD